MQGQKPVTKLVPKLTKKAVQKLLDTPINNESHQKSIPWIPTGPLPLDNSADQLKKPKPSTAIDASLQYLPCIGYTLQAVKKEPELTQFKITLPGSGCEHKVKGEISNVLSKQ